jgi:hypothetical protein
MPAPLNYAFRQTVILQDFRLPPQCSCGLCSPELLRGIGLQLVMGVSAHVTGPIFKDQLFQEDGADILSWNVGNQLPMHAVLQLRRAKASGHTFILNFHLTLFLTCEEKHILILNVWGYKLRCGPTTSCLHLCDRCWSVSYHPTLLRVLSYFWTPFCIWVFYFKKLKSYTFLFALNLMLCACAVFT